MSKWFLLALSWLAWAPWTVAYAQDLGQPVGSLPVDRPGGLVRLPPIAPAGVGNATAATATKEPAATKDGRASIAAATAGTTAATEKSDKSPAKPSGGTKTLPADMVIEPPAKLLQADVVIEPPAKLWEGSFELGLDGTEGNSKTFNFRFGADAKRKTPLSQITLDLDYHKTNSDYVETANKAFLDWRYERFYRESPWTAFVHGTVDYDEFQAFDARVSADMGLGYRFLKNDTTSLSARLGAGFSHETGGPDDKEYVPEAVYEIDFEHRLNDRHKLTFSSEYTPEMTGYKDFRLRGRASWETLIDKRMNLSLKFSAMDRYDSSPNGKKPNDLDYSAVLLWRY